VVHVSKSTRGKQLRLTACREIHRTRRILPQPIRDYIHTVNSTLEFLAESDAVGPLEQRLKLFQEIRHTFGKTALVLSGGGALGTFHLVRFYSRRG
jgi:TAG lipase / steryl ester hydrolase / phospholipase A2 / LPA acyltransferase